MERLLLLFSDMNYGLVDSLMKEFEQKNSLMIPGDLRRKVNMFNCLPCVFIQSCPILQTGGGYFEPESRVSFCEPQLASRHKNPKTDIMP